jgi:VIT1/CCC1 family predicted Fe2+/Mn2+ transporter
MRSEAILGSFDGTVSIVGFIFGMLAHHASLSLLVAGGIGGTIAATVSMATGDFEENDHLPRKDRFHGAAMMAMGTLMGSLIPIVPFMIFSRHLAIVFAALGCLAVAGWIGWEKHRGWRGYLEAYSTLLGAIGLSLLIVGFLPASA